MKKPSKARYLQEIDRLVPQVRRQYTDWVRRLVDAASVTSVERWITTGNIDQMLREIRITVPSLTDIAEAVRDIFRSGGSFEEPVFAEARFTFDIRNPEAELWLRDNSSKLITGIVASQRQAVQTALESGVREGKGPRSIALDIIGRRDTTGHRRGGIVGLNRPQASYVGAAYNELSSGDPSLLRSYLTRERRDRRFDATVRRAIDGRPLTPKQVNQITGRYSDRLLQLRGEMIARTETISAFNAGRDQAWNQAVEEGLIDQNFITNRWSATGDALTRDSHMDMNNQKQPHGQPFRSPLGSLMRYPGDTGLGAKAEDVINCRCFLERSADFIAMEAAA
tara:strand:+ start:20951 stop:21964 length:1014 start_codon:yes stop_codon:yes gene_type:complete